MKPEPTNPTTTDTEKARVCQHYHATNIHPEDTGEPRRAMVDGQMWCLDCLTFFTEVRFSPYLYTQADLDAALAKEREATWEKAIAAVRKVGNTIATGEDYNEFHGLMVDVFMELEAARNEGNSKHV